MTQNVLTPFMLETAGVRGRITRLHEVADTILSRHDYPEVVSALLGEALVIAAMLSSQLKQEGVFTIQIRGEGLVSLLVVDAVYGGELRGYADIAPENVAALRAFPQATPSQMFGENSYLAITLDPGEGMQRYQGVVALEGESLGDALQAYFTHSQQLAMCSKTVSRRDAGGKWQAAGIMIEHIASEGGIQNEQADDDGWRYAQAMLHTVTPEELLSAATLHEVLLYQLFHENGIIVYPEHSVTVGCRCSRERMQQLLLSMSRDDRAEMMVDGKVSVHCQFCNTLQEFSSEQIGLSLN